MNSIKKKQSWNFIKRDKKRRFFLSAGTFFFILQFFIFFGNSRAEHYDVFFWFCNHTPLIFAFAFFLGKKDLIKGLVNVGFIAQFAWTLDLFFKLLFNTYIFGVCNYVFERSTGPWILIPIGIHVFATNIAFLLTANVKPGKTTLYYSAVYLLILYCSSLVYTFPGENVNCIYYLCGFPEMESVYYSALWIVIAFITVVLPTQGIQYLVYMWCRKAGFATEEE